MLPYGSRRNSPASSWFVHESQIRGQITTRPETPRFPFEGHDRSNGVGLFYSPCSWVCQPGCCRALHVIRSTDSELQYRRYQKRHPQSFRRCLSCVLSSREEDVKPWMMWMMKTSTFYSQSMISPTQKNRIIVSTRSIKYFHCITSSRILYRRRGGRTHSRSITLDLLLDRAR